MQLRQKFYTSTSTAQKTVMLLSSNVDVHYCRQPQILGVSISRPHNAATGRPSSTVALSHGSWSCRSKANQAKPVFFRQRAACQAGRFREVSTPKQQADALARMISKEIKDAECLTDLQNVVNEWGGSFDFIHVSAAFSKAAKLPGSRSAAAKALLQQLTTLWLPHLPEADVQAHANVLWACGRSGLADSKLWGSTMEAFMVQLERSLAFNDTPAQELSNVLWAHAKLRRQPTPAQLQALLQAFVQPAVLEAAAPQAISNTVWALGELQRQPGGQHVCVPKDFWQHLLRREQIAKLQGSAPQALSNTLLGLGRLSSGSAPLLSLGFAQQCARQLLRGVTAQRLGSWKPQEVSNSMWACAELQLLDVQLFEAATATSPMWLPASSNLDLAQAALACGKLHYKDEQLVRGILQRSQQLLQQCINNTNTARSIQRALSAADKASLVGTVACTVAVLDLQQLAGDVAALVASSGIKQQTGQLPRSSAHQLQRVHSWLLQHQLLDGRGLTDLLTQQQLQQNARRTTAWGDNGV